MFKIIHYREVKDYLEQGKKVYCYRYYKRRDKMSGIYTTYCIADSIITARKMARVRCRVSGYTFESIKRYWQSVGLGEEVE